MCGVEGFDPREHLADQGRPGDDIGVKDEDPIAARGASSGVDARGEAAVLVAA